MLLLLKLKGIKLNICHGLMNPYGRLDNMLDKLRYIYIYIYIYNHLFELARERGMKVARACEPASARLFLQTKSFSYFKNTDFTSSLHRNITLRLATQ